MDQDERYKLLNDAEEILMDEYANITYLYLCKKIIRYHLMLKVIIHTI